jgi:hypothetical protein
VKGATCFKIVIEHKRTMLGVAYTQASQYGWMPTFGAHHSHPAGFEQLMQHFCELLIFG